MDGLALLCNLHADGPLTLRHLRQAGVSTLRDLEGFPETTLTSWLGGPRARRFVQEARQLAGRLAEARLEPEEDLEPPSDGAHAGGPGQAAQVESRFSQRAGPSEVQGTLLRPGAIEGLEAETCARLSSHGVLTFEALVAETSLALARRTGIPFPKLLDLSALARTLTERIELQPEPPRRTPVLEEFSIAPSVRTLPRSAPRTHALEKAASAAEPTSRRDPGVAGPFG